MIESNTDVLKQLLLDWESVKTLSLNNIVKNISLPEVIKVVYEVIKSYRNVLVCIGSLLGFVCVMSYCTNKIKQMRLELEDTVHMKKQKLVLKKQQTEMVAKSPQSAQSRITKLSIEFAKKLEEMKILNEQVAVLKKPGRLISDVDKATKSTKEIKELRQKRFKEIYNLVCAHHYTMSKACDSLQDVYSAAAGVFVGEDLYTGPEGQEATIPDNKAVKKLEWQPKAVAIEGNLRTPPKAKLEEMKILNEQVAVKPGGLISDVDKATKSTKEIELRQQKRLKLYNVVRNRPYTMSKARDPLQKDTTKSKKGPKVQKQ